MDSQKPTIGFYGLGSMGIGMAKNLASHLKTTGGQPLKYSNRTVSKGDQLKDFGAVPEAGFTSLVKSCDIIFTMISNDEVLNGLVQEALTCDVKGKIIVDCSTVHPDTSAAASDKLVAAGAQFLASPVFGASAMAAQGKLIFAVAGPEDASKAIEPLVVGVMGKSILQLGTDVKRSSLLKITGNCMVIGMQELISECHTFAECSGLGTEIFHQFVTDMYGPTASGYSARCTTGSFAPPLDGPPPGFAIDLSIKDAKHALNIAQKSGAFLPTMQAALQNMLSAKAFAGPWLDSSALYGTLRQWAGLPFGNAASRAV
ncbi:6-phosphogluconate dehydrogenase family protein [Pseudomassariella vexata]|uniref:6-phosphogluconate dehydrogenase family protein n=1 Tax=Pseudomassariella vexata TaxID=1141098 RepID=A0A1Y2E3Q5_9PEZI|nr:6-phosphogluconate dehydrogenase family protein [Pseudomassariella vexata]ORY66077.1 6-phosphogluconate dehydrogenase family protein [Pseudomassariella vexata]